jgi:hypothetical protein
MRHTVCETLTLFLSCSFALLAVSQTVTAGAGPIDFSRDVRPILSDKCFVCHGPDGGSRQADLRLDREENAKESVIVPGKPDESELIARISSADEDERMPPHSSRLALSSSEILLLQRWIQQGAVWGGHWAFTPPRRIPLPTVKNASWPSGEIDRFVLHRLERADLSPAEPAGRATLIRRVTFDLTGLPPTLNEIDAFLADAAPLAYERVVDRLLKSDRYGERMASEWLDVARYSDSYGYQVDRDRFVWPWRDWVIRALNRNLPYNEFITEQLAGDLLPHPTDDQILATAFNRLHPQKVEGGSVPEEFRIEYVADRTQTLATAFLGLTMQCCRCHDHKFDPFLQKEYYQLSAFFDNIDEAGLYSFFTQSVPTPTLLLADAATQAKMAALAQRIAAAEKKLALTASGRRAAFQQWLRGRPHSDLPAGKQSEHADRGVVPGRIALLSFEENPKAPNQSVAGKLGRALKLTGDDGVEVPVGNFRRDEPFSIALWMKTSDEKHRAVVFHRSRAWTDAGSRGYQLLIEDGCLSASLIHFWPGNAMRVKTRRKVPTGEWLHVAVTYDGSTSAGGLRIFVNGELADCQIVRDSLVKQITGGGGDHITIGARFRDHGFTGGLVDEFQVFNRQLTPIEVAQLHDDMSLVKALETPARQLSSDEREALYAYYLATADAETVRQQNDLGKIRKERSDLIDSMQEIMVMREMSQPHATYLLKRGAYDAHGDRVEAGTPAVLPPFPKQAPHNRLGLAQWLTAPGHPLTARVAVNRYWQMLLGDGLVRTPADFGSQGQRPTHPDLLDYLARDFVDHGWDLKRLVKQIVMSATYRQASLAAQESTVADPENRLLARASVYQLPAEMLRDNVLAASGLLVDRIGGSPAKPYEVEVSFKPVARDKGAGLYRRSLYTYWKRTGPAPAMMTLDAAKRDVCQVRRERTTSPLQVFVLMNGPQFVEAARGLSERLIRTHGDETDAVIAEMFRSLTSRRPTTAQQHVLRDLFDKQLAYFADHPQSTREYLAVGDGEPDPEIDAARLAATSAVANALMSFDESVMKR